MPSLLHRQKTLFNGFPYISNADRTDRSVLVQSRKSSLDNLSNSHSLAYCLSHCFQDNLFSTLLLKKISGVADVAADQALRSDTDLILVNGRLGLWFLNLLVPIHGAFDGVWRGREEREKP